MALAYMRLFADKEPRSYLWPLITQLLNSSGKLEVRFSYCHHIALCHQHKAIVLYLFWRQVLLCSREWPQINDSSCLSLLGVGITGMYACIYPWPK
jgi:hypothetical protein